DSRRAGGSGVRQDRRQPRRRLRQARRAGLRLMPHVTVMYSPGPRQVLEWPLELPEGATLRDAALASGWPEACPGHDVAALEVGVWGRRGSLEQPARDGDRVEVYRPLQVDPKVARRERFRKQGAGPAGLFAKRRPGAKPGY